MSRVKRTGCLDCEGCQWCRCGALSAVRPRARANGSSLKFSEGWLSPRIIRHRDHRRRTGRPVRVQRRPWPWGTGGSGRSRRWRKARILALRWVTEFKTPRRMAWRPTMPNHTSTRRTSSCHALASCHADAGHLTSLRGPGWQHHAPVPVSTRALRAASFQRSCWLRFLLKKFNQAVRK